MKNSAPVTYLSATARIQRMGQKQKSARRLQAAQLRRAPSIDTAALATYRFSRTKTNLPAGLSQSERQPLQTPEQRALHHTGQGSNDSINNGNEPKIEVEISTKDALMDIVFGKYISFLLVSAPIALWANHFQWAPPWIFWLNFFAMVPLASILGDFTEELAFHTNQTIGGLLNATFGNAVEVVVGIQALIANEIRVVQASMLGSIFSNLLLVLGCCFFFGGLYYKEQTINSAAAASNMGLLALSSIALVLPTPFAEYYNLKVCCVYMLSQLGIARLYLCRPYPWNTCVILACQDEHVLNISRMSAIFLMFMYLQLLFFQLHTHAHIFEDTKKEKDDDDDEEEEEEEEDEQPSISMAVVMAGLLISTLLVTYFSEYLVGAIDGYCKSSGISRTFVGLIILPIVGNAVEHITAVNMAMKNKMDLSMGGTYVIVCTVLNLQVGMSLLK
jgi:Ca2+:H+ antiporter